MFTTVCVLAGCLSSRLGVDNVDLMTTNRQPFSRRKSNTTVIDKSSGCKHMNEFTLTRARKPTKLRNQIEKNQTDSERLCLLKRKQDEPDYLYTSNCVNLKTHQFRNQYPHHNHQYRLAWSLSPSLSIILSLMLVSLSLTTTLSINVSASSPDSTSNSIARKQLPAGGNKTNFSHSKLYLNNIISERQANYSTSINSGKNYVDFNAQHNNYAHGHERGFTSLANNSHTNGTRLERRQSPHLGDNSGTARNYDKSPNKEVISGVGEKIIHQRELSPAATRAAAGEYNATKRQSTSDNAIWNEQQQQWRQQQQQQQQVQQKRQLERGAKSRARRSNTADGSKQRRPLHASAPICNDCLAIPLVALVGRKQVNGFIIQPTSKLLPHQHEQLSQSEQEQQQQEQQRRHRSAFTHEPTAAEYSMEIQRNHHRPSEISGTYGAISEHQRPLDGNQSGQIRSDRGDMSRGSGYQSQHHQMAAYDRQHYQYQHHNEQPYSQRQQHSPLEPQSDDKCPMSGPLTVCDQINSYPADVILDKVEAAKKLIGRRVFNLDSFFSDESQQSSDPFEQNVMLQPADIMKSNIVHESNSTAFESYDYGVIRGDVDHMNANIDNSSYGRHHGAQSSHGSMIDNNNRYIKVESSGSAHSDSNSSSSRHTVGKSTATPSQVVAVEKHGRRTGEGHHNRAHESTDTSQQPTSRDLGYHHYLSARTRTSVARTHPPEYQRHLRSHNDGNSSQPESPLSGGSWRNSNEQIGLLQTDRKSSSSSSSLVQSQGARIDDSNTDTSFNDGLKGGGGGGGGGGHAFRGRQQMIPLGAAASASASGGAQDFLYLVERQGVRIPIAPANTANTHGRGTSGSSSGNSAAPAAVDGIGDSNEAGDDYQASASVQIPVEATTTLSSSQNNLRQAARHIMKLHRDAGGEPSSRIPDSNGCDKSNGSDASSSSSSSSSDNNNNNNNSSSSGNKNKLASVSDDDQMANYNVRQMVAEPSSSASVKRFINGPQRQPIAVGVAFNSNSTEVGGGRSGNEQLIFETPPANALSDARTIVDEGATLGASSSATDLLRDQERKYVVGNNGVGIINSIAVNSSSNRRRSGGTFPAMVSLNFTVRADKQEAARLATTTAAPAAANVNSSRPALAYEKRSETKPYPVEGVASWLSAGPSSQLPSPSPTLASALLLASTASDINYKSSQFVHSTWQTTMTTGSPSSKQRESPSLQLQNKASRSFNRARRQVNPQPPAQVDTGNGPATTAIATNMRGDQATDPERAGAALDVQGGEQVQPVCRARSIYISPRAALNDKKQWKYVVNAAERDSRIKQIIRVDICENPFEPCSAQITIPFGFTSQCKQKYAKKKLLALDSQTGLLEVDTFFIPSCCVCQLILDTSRSNSGEGEPSTMTPIDGAPPPPPTAVDNNPEPQAAPGDSSTLSATNGDNGSGGGGGGGGLNGDSGDGQ